LWNEPFWDNKDFERVNNCLAYSMMDRDNIYHRRGKPQPGDRGGCGPNSDDGQQEQEQIKTCPELTDADYLYHPQEIVKRLRNDYSSCPRELIFPEDEGMSSEVPPPGYYKVALLIAKSNGMYDYHFVRLDSNGFWSHKPGATAVQNVDASGSLITDPQHDDFYYDPNNRGTGYNYTFYRYIFVKSEAPTRAHVMKANFEYANKQYESQPDLDYDPKGVNASVRDAPDKGHEDANDAQ